MSNNFVNTEDLLSQNEKIESHNERSLWRAVILQAIIDSLSNCKRTEHVLEREKARRWFAEMGENFIMVCTMAGYNPKYVQKKAQDFIAKNKYAKTVLLLKAKLNNKSS